MVVYITCYDALMKDADHNKKIAAIKEGDISTDQLSEYLAIDNKDEAFVEFRTFADNVARQTIMDCYGKFWSSLPLY